MANPGNRIWWKMVGASLVEEQLACLIAEKLAGITGKNRAATEAWAFFAPKHWRDANKAGQAMQPTASRRTTELMPRGTGETVFTLLSFDYSATFVLPKSRK